MSKHIHWQDVRQLNSQQLPHEARPWLLDRGSLTARLIEATQGDFRVQRLSQGWLVPALDEARLLGLKPRQKALVREVLLVCHGEPWIYARSVIPSASMQGELGFLRKLKNSALGALLFSDPFLQRSEFEISALELPCATIPVKGRGRIFGRRSLFRLRQQPLLVAEFFLPSCRLNELRSAEEL